MNRNFTKIAFVSSMALSIALLSAPQAEAGIFSKMKEIAKAAATKAITVAKDPNVHKAVLGTGTAVAGALGVKKAVSKPDATTPMTAE